MYRTQAKAKDNKVALTLRVLNLHLAFTLFTHDYLNRLQIGFVVKWLESGLIASTFTHSLANGLRLRQNYDYLHRLNNSDIVGGELYLFRKGCSSVACVFVGKTSS